MFALPLLLLAFALPADTVPRTDSLTYASPALRTLVAAAAEINRRVPDSLGGYRAHLESEISIGNRRAERMEMAVSLEQVASILTWDRTGAYQQEVNGYRTQAIGTTFSSLGLFRSGWAIPSLYGNRIALLFGRDTSESARRRDRRRGGDPLYAIHPLATDRERYYRFSGGDTVVIMRANGREIPIVRVVVALRPDVPAKSVVFLGEIDLDASRNHIVRLRGYFAVVGGPKPKFDLLREAGLQGVAYVEAENAEVEGQFWLPLRQRFEAHATSNTVGDGRAVFRILTRFVDRELTPVPADVMVGSAEDTLRIQPFRLAVAANDTLRAFSQWTTELGEMTAEVSAEDFNDVAPDRWRATGPPRFSIETERLGDVIRADRVQGIFTGIGAVMRFRDAAPGLTLRGAAGWAWSEGTARGRVSVERKRGPWLLELRGGRSLDNTNDFRVPFDSGNTFGALFASQDPYDYVDRRSAALAAVRTIGDRRALIRTEIGFADDRYSPSTYVRSPLGGTVYRPNRGLDEGSYLRSAALIEWHPDVSAEFVKPGVSARLSYERGDGTLTFQRVEARVVGRRPFGPFVAIARGDMGTLLGHRPPPQQLFELGEQQNLPGYLDKEFAGTRAAVLRGTLQYTSPLLRQPLRVGRAFLPAIAPGLSVGVQSGWAEASTDAGRAAIDRLAVIDPTSLALWAPVSRPSDGIRASVTAGLRLFSGGVFVGGTRKVDQAAPWKLLVTFGQQW